MRAIWGWTLVAAGVAGACAPSEKAEVTATGTTRVESSAPAAAPQAVPAAPAADVSALRAGIQARADSADRALRKVRGLSREDRADLRADVNARQLAVAQNMGVRASGTAEIERL